MFLAFPKVEILHDRAEMFDKVRAFFKERQVREVDCPIVSAAASVDLHIDLIPCLDASGNKRYLHSSPEYGMKRLLADGIGDIYQLSHVFRQGEYGRKHNPEFMMAEWYRCDFTFQLLIEETFDFIRLFLGPLPSKQISYRQAFKQYVGYDHVHASPEKLLQTLREHEIPLYDNILEEGKDALLNQIVGNIIEPQLGHEGLTALAHFPSTQAALAQTVQEGDAQVAERFEVYYQGVELCNGYHELANPSELRQRFEEANRGRLHLGKEALPIDESFLAALARLPDCCGVAVGVDRLMMLRHGCSSISEVIPFDWNAS